MRLQRQKLTPCGEGAPMKIDFEVAPGQLDDALEYIKDHAESGDEYYIAVVANEPRELAYPLVPDPTDWRAAVTPDRQKPHEITCTTTSSGVSAAAVICNAADGCCGPDCTCK